MDVIIEAYNRNLLRLEDNRSYVLGMQKKAVHGRAKVFFKI
jgi:hypothetical protein